MATIIEQQPFYTWQMAADDFLCTVSNDAVVSGVPTGYFNVKFVAEVFIDSEPINTGTSAQLIGSFKAIPNNLGRGIYNFKSVIENYVNAQNEGFPGTSVALGNLPPSTYKTVGYDVDPHPIHVIDKFALNEDCMRYVKIQFKLEGATTLGAPVDIIPSTSVNSIQFIITNTYVPSDATYIQASTTRYSWLKTDSYYMKWPQIRTGHYLTNVPVEVLGDKIKPTQKVNVNDYHTLSFLNALPFGTTKYTFFTWYDEDGVMLNYQGLLLGFSNGAVYPETTSTDTQYVTVGCGPGNLKQASAQFKTDLDAGLVSYYTVENRDGVAAADIISHVYRFDIECSPFNNYEPIRLCWLNQLGAWDYYSFNRKSTTSLTSKKTEYSQLAGTWNGEYWQRKGWKGGKKTFRSNTTTKIKMNTAYIDERFNVIFEELINSPEVYVLQPYVELDVIPSAHNNKYVHPARLKTSSFTRKTKANDNLIQYSFEVEMSKIQGVQNA
jgi:hypothetical protein|tara:strand:+ start:2208 stop:3689 length:1482 start_codon:yes stop_codon:yes gene_type:complete